MSVQFKYLFTQLEIGPVTTKNRIQYTPTASNFAAVDGLPSETMAYYVAERAKGGTGLIDFSLVIPSPEPYLSLMVNTCIRGYDSRVVPGYKKIADMAHEHGAKVFAELASWGAWSGGYAPSPVPSAQTHGTPQILTKEGIEEIANYYGTTAKYVKEGGLDGVDLHGTHGLLINQFLSPMYNKRTDEYGGSTENRMRFLLQILDRVRENVGSDIAVGMRLIGDELIPGGINIDEAKKIAQRLDASGKVDFINMDIGIEPQQVHIAQAPLYVEPGFEIYASAAVKEVVKKVVVGGVGRIHDPMLAEKVLEEGKADIVGMTRALIADPELPNKTKAGRIDDIRPCLSDNENCLGFLFAGVPMRCTVNPAVGQEKELGLATITRASKRKKVLVVGGGPAGLESARMAAVRGHEVHLYEKEGELGGRINLTAKIPGREEIANIVRWFKLQLETLGINVVLGKEVTPDVVAQLKPDAVVVATGSLPIKTGLQPVTFTEIPGWNSPNIVSVDDVFKGTASIGKNVVVLDQVGFVEGLGVSEYLAKQGKNVEIVSALPFIGSELISNQHLFFMYPRAAKEGVRFTPNTFIRQIQGSTVVVFDVHTNVERRIENVDNVLLITGRQQNDRVYQQLKGKVSEIYAVGDCRTYSLYFGDAVRDGHRVARLL